MRKEHPDYTISNITGEACLRRLKVARPASLHFDDDIQRANKAQCDKMERGGEDDPCSECRWFGGDNCRCVLEPGGSYNDQIWYLMMNRHKSGYTLPEDRSRSRPDGHPMRRALRPMPGSKVKANSAGDTKKQLLAELDMLPSFVRELPRAYQVPPRQSNKEKNPGAFQRINGGIKRKRDDNKSSLSPGATETSTVSNALPPFPGRPWFPRPPTHRLCGEVRTTSWS